MNTKLATTLLTTLLMTGFSLAQDASTTAPAAAAPAEAAVAPAAMTSSCCSHDKAAHAVLTKEERHRFCCAKAAAIAAHPELAGKGHKKELCEAICKQDPSMEPIMMKLKKHCEEMHKKMKGAACPAN